MTKADGIKRVREANVPPAGGAVTSGARPKRYKGYYRALKRGEPWAVRHFRLPGMSRLLDKYISQELLAEELGKRSRFLDHFVACEHAWSGGAISVPFALDEKSIPGDSN